MRTRRKSWWGKPLLALVVVLVSIAVFLSLFYIPNEQAEVLGSTRYTDAEIRQLVMPGFIQHNSLYLRFFRNTLQTKDVPFVDSIEVESIARDQVRLHVNEDYPIGYLAQDGYRYYFDSAGVVVEALEDKNAEEPEPVEAEQTETEESASVPEDALQAESLAGSDTDFHPALTDVSLVTGLTEERVAIGDQIPVAEPRIFTTLLGLSKLISKFEVQPDRIEVGEGGSITLWYKEVAIALGDGSLLEEKMSRAAAILPQLVGMKGTLHLENFDEETINIIFSDKKEETEEEKQEDTGILQFSWKEDGAEESPSDQIAEEDSAEESLDEEGTEEEISWAVEDPEEIIWEETDVELEEWVEEPDDTEDFYE